MTKSAGDNPNASAVERRKKPRFSVSTRLRYRIDELFTRGTLPVIATLAVGTATLVIVAAIALALTNVAFQHHRAGFLEAFWASLLRTLDPGTMGSDAGWPFRVISLIVTLSGLFVVSSLIGIIGSGIDRRLERLRRGRSEVIEHGFTLILGWSSKTTALVREIVEANVSKSSQCVVIMSERDKVAMDEELHVRVGHMRTTKLVTRTGMPSDVHDLDIVHPELAKTVVVLRPEEATGDAQVVRSALAVLSRTIDIDIPIIIELSDLRCADALKGVTEERVHTVVSSDLIARIAAQTCVHRGIGHVYEHLLGFTGNELYFHSEPQLEGCTMAKSVLAFERSCPVGLMTDGGTLELAPAPSRILKPGEQFLLVASDDSEIGGIDMRHDGNIVEDLRRTSPTVPERTLILGWSDLGPLVLCELDRDAAPGSGVHVAVVPELVTPDSVRPATALNNLSLTVSAIDRYETKGLQRLMSHHDIQHVVLLCYRNDIDAAESDALNLMTLLELRELLRDEVARPTIVSEFLDERDVDLAITAEADDFIVSERLTALLIAQLGEMPELHNVWIDLLDHQGPEIVLMSPGEYHATGFRGTFRDLCACVLRGGDYLIGYRIGRDKPQVNPPKEQFIELPSDAKLIVMSNLDRHAESR